MYLLYPSITQAMFEVFRNKNLDLKYGVLQGCTVSKLPGGVPCNTRNILVKKRERWHSERNALGVLFYSQYFCTSTILIQFG